MDDPAREPPPQPRFPLPSPASRGGGVPGTSAGRRRSGDEPGETHERYVERIIREAQEQGEFDHLRGAGRPLPLTGALEEAWWIKEKLRREKLSDLPDSLAIRLEAERLLESLPRLSDERVVRERLEELDARIRKINRTTVSGPATTLAPLDVEVAVERWRAARAALARADDPRQA